MSDEKKKFRKAAEAIDLNLGGLLGSLGEALGEAVQKLAEAGEGVVDHEVQGTKGPIRTHAGVRVRMGGLAASGPKPVNPGRARAAEAPVARALDCELIEDGAGWMITAEMPGVAPSEVELSVEGAELTIRSTGARTYEGRVTLPAPCPRESIAQSLVNGILTLTKGAA